MNMVLWVTLSRQVSITRLHSVCLSSNHPAALFPFLHLAWMSRVTAGWLLRPLSLSITVTFYKPMGQFTITMRLLWMLSSVHVFHMLCTDVRLWHWLCVKSHCWCCWGGEEIHLAACIIWKHGKPLKIFLIKNQMQQKHVIAQVLSQWVMH